MVSARSRAGARPALLLLLAALAAGAGCAAPAPPTPRARQVPDQVTDLRVHQAGKTVVLHFTLPQEAVRGSSLAGPRRVQIFRSFGSVPGTEPTGQAVASPGPPSYTLDASQLSGDLAGDTVTFPDTLTEADFQAHEGKKVTYRVRTAAGESEWSALSKAASVTLVAPPAAARDLRATVNANAVMLRWSPPPPGASAPAPGSFAIYRTPLDSNGSAAGTTEAVGLTTGTSYRDSSVAPGRRYRYTVRGMSPAPGGEVESADSSPVEVNVPLLAGPAPPEGVAAIPLRSPTGSLEVDVSWAIAGERDLAGYNVYRSERPGERGKLLNRRPVPAAAFRDATVTAGRVYYYSVTSVGPGGKESSPSAPIAVKMPASGAKPS